MRVHFVCGYYSHKAHAKKKRTEPYWDAYNYVWAVKSGLFKHKFRAWLASGPVDITGSNFGKVREWFGSFIVSRLNDENAPSDVLIIPIPSKDGITSAGSYRTLTMVKEAMRGQLFEDRITDGLRWTEKLPPAHEGGRRNRQFWKDHLHVRVDVTGTTVVLVDDVLSTGSTLLAARDVLEAHGATVLGAITCGRTIYDFNTKHFGNQSIEFDEELHEYED